MHKDGHNRKRRKNGRNYQGLEMADLEIHDGVSIPTLAQSLDPFDIEWLGVVWDERLCDATIETSTWTIPPEWAPVSYAQGATVSIGGVDYQAVNAIMVDINNAPVGRYVVSNQVTLSDGRQFERSFKIKIKEM